MRKFSSLNLTEAIRSQVQLLREIKISSNESIHMGIQAYVRFFPDVGKVHPNKNGWWYHPSNTHCKWAHHLHKVHPITYRSDLLRGKINLNLHDVHNRQTESIAFGAALGEKEIQNKRQGVLHSPINYDALISEYGVYLYQLRENKKPILTPAIRLVLHAHMHYHEEYMHDTRKIFGYPLDHKEEPSNDHQK